MTARILVVDDVPANIRILEARLLAEYYEVIPARNGFEALDICQAGHIDVVLLDVMMPDMDGFEVCRRLKADPRTTNIPVVMVTSLDRPEDRVKGLEAGADDFLSKPVNDLQLMSRIKSLARLKSVSDELFQRAGSVGDAEVEALMSSRSNSELQTSDAAEPVMRFDGGQPVILLIDEDVQASARLAMILSHHYRVETVSDPTSALIRAVDGGYDCVIASSTLAGYDPLRLCSQLRTIEQTRLLPIILIVHEDEGSLVIKALELGINDYLMRPLDRNELLARVRTQIKRKRYNDLLRQSLNRTIVMAITDSLTGLHNRRYLDSHMSLLMTRAIGRERPLSLVMIDLDHFKQINDHFGHDAGDEVLREFASRLHKNIRGMDLACRYGGEEFVVILPDTDVHMAAVVAERIRETVAGAPFPIQGGKRHAKVTVSLGIACLVAHGDSVEKLFKRADMALYAAKRNGRNCVACSAA